MKYIYPAVFTPEADGGYLVDFPDLPNCFTDGADLAEAFENAEDALALKLWYMEEHGETPGSCTTGKTKSNHLPAPAGFFVSSC